MGKDFKQINNSKGMSGFTLAEVLITLGIIGVVAAMTLPTLIAKHQEKAHQVAFKKAYSMLGNAVNSIIAENEYIVACRGNIGSDTAETSAECVEFNKLLQEKFQPIKYCETQPYDNGCMAYIRGYDKVELDRSFEPISHNYFQFKDNEIQKRRAYITKNGMSIVVYSDIRSIYLVDTNGLRGPNKWGHDVFVFSVNKNGKILCSDLAVEPGGKSCKQRLGE